MGINDDIQQMIAHVDQASRLMNDPVFMKKLKRYSSSDNILQVSTIAGILTAVIGGVFSDALIGVGAGIFLIGVMRHTWNIIQQGRLYQRAEQHHCVKDKYFSQVTLDDMEPAPLKAKVVVTQRAAHVANNDVAAQLAQIAKRDDVPMGWWECVDHIVLKEIEREKKEKRRQYNEQHNNDTVLLEQLDQIASKDVIVVEDEATPTEADHIHSNKPRHINI